MSNPRKIAVVIVAGGSGTRVGGDIPKQFRELAGAPLVSHTIKAFLDHDSISWIQLVSSPTLLEELAQIAGVDARILPIVEGGETRQLSVLAGLKALKSHTPDIVLIHDAARPNISQALIGRVIDALSHAEAVLPATQVIDTIKRSSDGRTIGGTEDRTQLYAAQTPQGFDFSQILAAHLKAQELTDGFTDDAAIAEWANMEVVLCEGDPDNIKVTLPGDFARVEALLGQHKKDNGMPEFETRVGSGMDIHRFVSGDAVTLGGVTIPHSARLDGHSDADAALHVLTDAILGALAAGDIGTHFPPSEPKWKGEPSSTFLRFAADLVHKRNGRIVHLDLTINAEAPKIGPHVNAMRQSIANIAGVDISRVSVKATTAEKMGFVGRQEGILTQAVATLEMPRESDLS